MTPVIPPKRIMSLWKVHTATATIPAPPDYVAELAGQIQQTFDRGGNLVIPSFAVGRTQEMLYFIREIKERRLVHGHDGFKVYVDSPLAIEATRVFAENYLDCYDTAAMALVQKASIR